MMPGDLKFDKMEVDTEVAKKYLASQSSEYHSNDFKENNSFLLDTLKNKIYTSSIKKPNADNIKVGNEADLMKSLDLLSDKLEKSIQLMCELEYMIRQRPVRVTKLDLEMLIKNLRNYEFAAEYCSSNVDHIPKLLVMKENSSLMGLGCVAQMLPVTIIATKNCAVVCDLFRKLCHEVGIKSVSLAFISDDEAVDGNIITSKAVEGGCIGVVTANSDVDSAVETFLTAPTHDPWGFRRILVQESACQRFKKSIAWKTKSTDESDVDPELERLSSDVYIYENKIFVREYVGERYCNTIIVIEEFRTVKELISLIEAISPFCVSLWSSEVAESHEISYGITAPLVWINDYGVLGVPLQVSEAYYSRISYVNETNFLTQSPQFEELLERQKDWVKLNLEKRTRIILDMLKSSLSIDMNYFQSYERTNLHRFCKGDNNFVHVGANSLVVGLEVPRDICTIRIDGDEAKCKDYLKYLIRNLLCGSGLLVYVSDANKQSDFAKFVTNLARSRVPVVVVNNDKSLLAISSYRKTRVIHTSFGTIFAN